MAYNNDFYCILLLFCGNCVRGLLAIPCGWLLYTSWTVCCQLFLHQSLLFDTDTVLFSIQERAKYHKNEIQQAVQQLEQQFLEFDPSPENLSADNLAIIAANVIAKKAAVTSATISYKIEEMHDSFKFKYTRLVRRKGR